MYGGLVYAVVGGDEPTIRRTGVGPPGYLVSLGKGVCNSRQGGTDQNQNVENCSKLKYSEVLIHPFSLLFYRLLCFSFQSSTQLSTELHFVAIDN
ncbi:hypothetical protein NE237_014261 [Protea cynaroides]|uniref:Uncharacterized protein n=1 Tax=Protea cynaroides TaxID=273540 RepID=A0A9Q0GKI7_9MAGN|nr:hypothetical protein NE237_014261 [Protea cynaroides]